jgi:hypothetical protein
MAKKMKISVINNQKKYEPLRNNGSVMASMSEMNNQ